MNPLEILNAICGVLAILILGSLLIRWIFKIIFKTYFEIKEKFDGKNSGRKKSGAPEKDGTGSSDKG